MEISRVPTHLTAQDVVYTLQCGNAVSTLQSLLENTGTNNTPLSTIQSGLRQLYKFAYGTGGGPQVRDFRQEIATSLNAFASKCQMTINGSYLYNTTTPAGQIPQFSGADAMLKALDPSNRFTLASYLANPNQSTVGYINPDEHHGSISDYNFNDGMVSAFSDTVSWTVVNNTVSSLATNGGAIGVLVPADALADLQNLLSAISS